MSKFHKHHIVPKHMGGSDSSENLKCISIEEHAREHLRLFEQYGKLEDYTAYRLLSGTGDKHEEIARLGGHIQGARNRDSGHMSRVGKMPNTEKQKVAAKAAMFEKMNNCFLDPAKRILCAKLGGKKQGRINAESGHCKKISAETAEKRSASMKGKIFVHNANASKLIPKEELDKYLETGWQKGRRSGKQFRECGVVVEKGTIHEPN